MIKWCATCKHWANFSVLRTNVKKSDFGQCYNSKIFGSDFLNDISKIDKELQEKDEVVVVKEYFSTPEKMPNETIITGKKFYCIHYEEGKNMTIKEVKKITNKRLGNE
jgi:hypothetical protein